MADLVKIGDLRRELFMEWDCLWNGVVREITAEMEQPDEWCSRSAVLKALHRRCANMMQAFDLVESTEELTRGLSIWQRSGRGGKP